MIIDTQPCGSEMTSPIIIIFVESNLYHCHRSVLPKASRSGFECLTTSFTWVARSPPPEILRYYHHMMMMMMIFDQLFEDFLYLHHGYHLGDVVHDELGGHRLTRPALPWDDDALVLHVGGETAVHVVRQGVDMRRVLICCLEIWSWYQPSQFLISTL